MQQQWQQPKQQPWAEPRAAANNSTSPRSNQHSHLAAQNQIAMPKALTSLQITEIKQKLFQKETMAKLSKEYGVSPKTIKRASENDENASPNRQSQGVRKLQVNLTIQQKMEIISKRQKGQCTQDLAKKRAVALEQEKRSLDCKRIHAKENVRDRALFLWFKKKCAAGIPVSGEKMKEESLRLNKEKGLSPDFKANNGWLKNFKKGYNIRELATQGEKLSADTAGADNFKNTLTSYLEEEGYDLNQVYNADETALYYKSLPKRTLAAGDERQASGFKEIKERVTVMCCAICQHRHNVVVKEVCEKYPEQKKVLLLLDNAPCHSSIEEHNQIDEPIRVMFLPPNATSLIQPMDQGVIAKLKKMFRNKLVKELMLQKESRCIVDIVKKQTIKDCCYKLASSWDDVTPKDIRNAWNRLLGKDESLCEQNVSTAEVNLLLALLKDSPDFVDCNFAMAAAWIEEDFRDNAWEQCDVVEIYDRLISPSNSFEENSHE
ncbi:jerky protein homolog-like [Phymastichus coffea]|uniref:jerky protein homolog-like n=1 Tax=Phymastichus coffea TaxID=108790 RepID=UPI00273C3F99|nr:jerky protein homolog-like [Phymastichus coffea]